MPELGKATYELVFNTTQVSKMANADARVDAATKSIASSVGMADRQLSMFGETAGAVAGEVSAAGAEMQGSMEETATVSKGAATEVAASNARIGASSRVAAAEVATGTGRIRKSFASMAEAGRASWKMLGMGVAGLGALSLFGGYKELKLENQGLAGINAAMQSNKNLAFASLPTLKALADTFERMGIESKGSALGMESLLLRYPQIRNEAGKGNDILNKTVIALREVDAGMQTAGRNVKLPQLAIMFGRALTDPAKGLSALGRAGVRFTAGQQTVIKALIAAKKPLEAQRFMVDTVIKTWKGADKAFGNTIQGKLKATKFAFEQMGKTLLVSILPVLTKLFGLLNRGMQWMKSHPQIVKALAVAFGVLYVSLKLVKMGVAALSVVIEADPVMILVTAVAALVAVFVLAVKYPKLLSEGLQKLGFSAKQAHEIVMKLRHAFEVLKTTAVKVWNDIRPIVMHTLGQIKSFVVALVGFIIAHWNTIRAVIGPMLAYWYNTFKSVMKAIGLIFAILTDLLTGKWGKMWNDILKLAGVAWGYLKNLFLTWATYVGNTFIIILNAFIWAMNQMLKYAGNILSAILNGFIRAWNEVASHSFGVLSTISKVSFNWGIGYIGMMGSIGASAGSAFSNGFAANAKVSGIISAEQSGKLETATFVHGRWVDAKTNKPLSGAQQKEATARFRARMGFKKGEPGGPTEGSQQDITGPKAGNPKVNIAIPSPGSVSVPTGPTPLNPGDFLTPTTKKKHKAKHHKAASGISNDPAYVAQEQAVAAARLKGTRAYRLALLKEEEWLKNRLKDSKLSAKKKLAYEKALYTVERELTAATKKQESMALADEKARYQIAIAIAERKGLAAGTGKNATVIQRRIKQMELDMLQEEEDRVKAMLRKKGLSLKQQASLQTQWTSLERKMSAIQATYTPGVLTFQNAPGKIKRALAKAARTTTLKDDIAAMEEERKWLEKMVNNKKLSLAMHMKYSDELRKLNLRIEEERRKIISSQNQLSLSEKELAAAMDVRGSFFAQFAGNIFGGSPGGLTLQPGTHGGGGGKSVKVEQNNTYNQPPPDPHQHAAAMRRAASGAMSGL